VTRRQIPIGTVALSGAGAAGLLAISAGMLLPPVAAAVAAGAAVVVPLSIIARARSRTRRRGRGPRPPAARRSGLFSRSTPAGGGPAPRGGAPGFGIGRLMPRLGSNSNRGGRPAVPGAPTRRGATPPVGASRTGANPAAATRRGGAPTTAPRVPAPRGGNPSVSRATPPPQARNAPGGNPAQPPSRRVPRTRLGRAAAFGFAPVLAAGRGLAGAGRATAAGVRAAQTPPAARPGPGPGPRTSTASTQQPARPTAAPTGSARPAGPTPNRANQGPHAAGAAQRAAGPAAAGAAGAAGAAQQAGPARPPRRRTARTAAGAAWRAAWGSNRPRSFHGHVGRFLTATIAACLAADIATESRALDAANARVKSGARFVGRKLRKGGRRAWRAIKRYYGITPKAEDTPPPAAPTKAPAADTGDHPVQQPIRRKPSPHPQPKTPEGATPMARTIIIDNTIGGGGGLFPPRGEAAAFFAACMRTRPGTHSGAIYDFRDSLPAVAEALNLVANGFSKWVTAVSEDLPNMHKGVHAELAEIWKPLALAATRASGAPTVFDRLEADTVNRRHERNAQVKNVPTRNG
jgi:hypothetical protein